MEHWWYLMVAGVPARGDLAREAEHQPEGARGKPSGAHRQNLPAVGDRDGEDHHRSRVSGRRPLRDL